MAVKPRINALATYVPLPASPIVDADGNVTETWYRFFTALLLRSGGSPGVNSATLSQSVTTIQNGGGSAPILTPVYTDIDMGDATGGSDDPGLSAFLRDEPNPNWMVDVTQAPCTRTNDSALYASLGEYITVSVAPGSAVAMTTATAANAASLSLNAGDYDLFGNIGFLPAAGATLANASGWTSLTSASVPAQPNGGAFASWIGGSAPAGNGVTLTIGSQRISLATVTTLYLSGLANFSGGTCGVFGFMGARRRR